MSGKVAKVFMSSAAIPTRSLEVWQCAADGSTSSSTEVHRTYCNLAHAGSPSSPF